MPSPSCSANFNYLDSPEFFSISLHILSAISTPIYLLGMYCILFKTPEAMKSVKWPLFTLHLWIVLFDYSVSVLVVPYLLIPEFAGIPYGVYRVLGVPHSFQALSFIIVLDFIFLSILAIYENRFFILCDFYGKATWAWARRIWLSSQYILVVVVFIPIYIMIPDQEKARQNVFQTSPCLPDFLYHEPMFVLATEYTYHTWAVIVLVSVFLLQMGLFITQLTTNGRQQHKRLSQKTYLMHKKFLLALFVQVMVPMVMLVLPIIAGMIIFLSNYVNRAAINICLIVAMTHGFVSTVVMILVHGPYRFAVKEIACKKEKKVESKKVTVLYA